MHSLAITKRNSSTRWDVLAMEGYVLESLRSSRSLTNSGLIIGTRNIASTWQNPKQSPEVIVIIVAGRWPSIPRNRYCSEVEVVADLTRGVLGPWDLSITDVLGRPRAGSCTRSAKFTGFLHYPKAWICTCRAGYRWAVPHGLLILDDFRFSEISVCCKTSPSLIEWQPIGQRLMITRSKGLILSSSCNLRMQFRIWVII